MIADVRTGNVKAILQLFFSLSRYKQQQKQQKTAKTTSSATMADSSSLERSNRHGRASVDDMDEADRTASPRTAADEDEPSYRADDSIEDTVGGRPDAPTDDHGNVPSSRRIERDADGELAPPPPPSWVVVGTGPAVADAVDAVNGNVEPTNNSRYCERDI